MRWRRVGRSGLLAGLVLAAGLLAACDGDSGTEPDPFADGVAEEDLTFLTFPRDAILPPITDTTFWAVAGEDRLLVLRYAPEAGDDEGEEFLEFIVHDDALWKWPDGSLVAEGDSVEIRVTLDPQRRFLFRFAPSGLEFHPDRPAELEINYRRHGGDLNDDGLVDDDDVDFEDRMRMWKQEAPGERWFPMGTIRIKDFDEIRGEITHFTGFAIAV